MTLALKPNPLLGVLLVLAAAALWGTTGTAQSLADGSLSAYWFGALRLAAASLFFAGCVAASRKLASADSTLKRGKLERRDVLGAGLGMAVYNLAFFAGIGTTGVALGTAIALGSGPIWAGLLQAVLHRRRPTAAWWTGTAVAAAGGVLMTLGGDWRTKGFDGVGILLCLLSGLSYAAYTLLNTRMARVAPASTITLQAFGVAAAVALPVAWLVGGAPAFTGADLAAVAYTGVVTAGVPYLLFSQALRHITPATGVTLALCEPVVAFGLAVLVIGERPAPTAYLGLLWVVCGVLWVVRQELRDHRRQEPSNAHREGDAAREWAGVAGRARHDAAAVDTAADASEQPIDELLPIVGRHPTEFADHTRNAPFVKVRLAVHDQCDRSIEMDCHLFRRLNKRREVSGRTTRLQFARLPGSSVQSLRVDVLRTAGHCARPAFAAQSHRAEGTSSSLRMNI